MSSVKDSPIPRKKTPQLSKTKEHSISWNSKANSVFLCFAEVRRGVLIAPLKHEKPAWDFRPAEIAKKIDSSNDRSERR
tara:strand:+ start:853 stop:1089 length:237 start_codon:yes stop_codon:yes gene_type:complete